MTGELKLDPIRVDVDNQVMKRGRSVDGLYKLTAGAKVFCLPRAISVNNPNT